MDDLTQLDICKKYFADHIPSPNNFKIGISESAMQGEMPINGLRHEIEGDTSGWYIWGGKAFSNDPNFFSPLHISHLKDKCPLIIKYLALPPGYRFLIDDKGYEDVWFDELILNQ
ncbi:hypothetical protein HYN59_16645 [Flavobacterium album]|uniref:Imm33-like domain-containing protein n=1 Tax=Flavobacterium album TaxID=2175091 RepID=A0A2S1R1X7_9FLAO|nr:hypothetical protein [Flavobacterium album]AWH86635.1 hypothetical protein HYN59_16645 [Flavobacterium album]